MESVSLLQLHWKGRSALPMASPNPIMAALFHGNTLMSCILTYRKKSRHFVSVHLTGLFHRRSSISIGFQSSGI